MNVMVRKTSKRRCEIERVFIKNFKAENSTNWYYKTKKAVQILHSLFQFNILFSLVLYFIKMHLVINCVQDEILIQSVNNPGFDFRFLRDRCCRNF